MVENKNVYEDVIDFDTVDYDEYVSYCHRRMQMMLKLESDAEKWFAKKKTPFQQQVLEMAHHHVELCKKRFGIDCQDLSL